jgi:hypothetical protein
MSVIEAPLQSLGSRPGQGRLCAANGYKLNTKPFVVHSRAAAVKVSGWSIMLDEIGQRMEDQGV